MYRDGYQVKGFRVLFFSILLLNLLFPFNIQEPEIKFIYTSKTIYTNNGSETINLSDFCTLNFFPNSSWQTTYLLSVNTQYSFAEDADQNQILLLDLPLLSPGDDVTLLYSFNVTTGERYAPNINLWDSGNLSDIPTELTEYCRSEGSWQVDNEVLRSLAENIWMSDEYTSNVLGIVLALANWIGNNIVPKTHDIPLYPNETYVLQEGDCDDQANLLITLCRILGIPAYLQIGCRRKFGIFSGDLWEGHVTRKMKDIGYHGWAMIYIPPWKWLPFDMTLGWSRRNALEGITSAVVWSSNTIVIADVIKSDWAGSGQWQKEYVINNSLFITVEDSLILDNTRTEIYENPVFQMGVLITLTFIGVYIVKKRFLNKQPTNSHTINF